MAKRDHVVLAVNGVRREVRGDDCFLNLAEYLRTRLGLVGTKIVCAEGDCGSCTALVGFPVGDRIRYRTLDSCIRLVFQLDGAHIVTVEGLRTASGLSPIQQAMVECHGSQCGYCTPGFVVAMTGIRENSHQSECDEAMWRKGLTGNLCRCTGYVSILEAAGRSSLMPGEDLETLFPFARRQAALAAASPTDDLILQGESGKSAFCPTSLRSALSFRKDHPAAKVIAGGTDVGVQLNKRAIAPSEFLDLNRVVELEHYSIVSRGDQRMLVAGARATWSDLEEVCRSDAPQFAELLSVFGSPQIRNVGTIAGNLINASPIADAVPFLLVMQAELTMASVQGERRVAIGDFYRGYKQFDLRPDELLTQVQVPLPKSSETLRLYKVSRRRDLDIATFTAAIRMRFEGDRIADADLAYGAVGPTVLRLHRTADFLRNRPFNESTMREAGALAIAEISPIADVRGSQEYRRQLARNVLLKFYHEQQACRA